MKSILTFTYLDRKYSIFLEIWISYYSKIENNKLVILYRNEIPEVPEEYSDIVILIDITNKINNCNSYIIDISIFNEFQVKFLKENDIVIYSDVDELIMHPNLNYLLQTFNSDFLVTHGVEIVQNLNLETDFNIKNTILSQRKYMVYSDWYDKPLILKNAHSWQDGKHNYTDIPPYPGLFLIHLGKICCDIYIKGWEETHKMYSKYRYKNITDFYKDYVVNWNDINHPSQPMVEITDTIKLLLLEKL
jgi:hypothetical protein